MKIKTKITCLITCIVFLHTSVCNAQHEVWRVYFPGYTSGKSSIDHKGFLHTAFIGNDPAHQNMFLTLNSKGAITYKKVVSNFPLYFLKDSSDCSYEISYDGASVTVDKYDPQQNLLWNHIYSFVTPVNTNNFSITEIQYSFQAVITPSGKLAMAGMLQDSSSINGLTLITADTSSGSQLITYVAYDNSDYVIEIQLQEDDNGSINMVAKDFVDMRCVRQTIIFISVASHSLYSPIFLN